MSQKRIQLYYSPRILEDIDPTNDENHDDNKQNEKYRKRFIHSIIREEKEKFHEMLPKMDLNDNSPNKWTPLIWAMQKDRVYYIQQMFATKQIIDFSVHIDSKTKRTPLHFASEKGDIRLLMLLLQKDKKQQSDQKNDQIKLRINAKDRDGCTALFRASKIGEPLIIKALLQHNADPNITNKNGISPLLIAAHAGHTDAVNALISDKRTNINLEDERGRNPLMVSCYEDRTEIVKLLLKFDHVNFNAIDYQNYSWNCLMCCVYRKNERMLNLLLSNDENKNGDSMYRVNYFHENYYGQNVLDMCIKRKLSKKVEEKIRSKLHSIIFPNIIESDLIVQLKIPVVVASMLLVYIY